MVAIGGDTESETRIGYSAECMCDSGRTTIASNSGIGVVAGFVQRMPVRPSNFLHSATQLQVSKSVIQPHCAVLLPPSQPEHGPVTATVRRDELPAVITNYIKHDRQFNLPV